MRPNSISTQKIPLGEANFPDPQPCLFRQRNHDGVERQVVDAKDHFECHQCESCSPSIGSDQGRNHEVAEDCSQLPWRISYSQMDRTKLPAASVSGVRLRSQVNAVFGRYWMAPREPAGLS